VKEITVNFFMSVGTITSLAWWCFVAGIAGGGVMGYKLHSLITRRRDAKAAKKAADHSV